MKFSSSLALFSLVAGISAAPAAPPSDGAITVYRAKVTSVHKPLNGKYLSTVGDQVGVFSGNQEPLSFYPRSGGGDGKVSLHTYPVGIIDHALALVGREKTALRSLTNLANPASSAFPAGTTADWTSFTMTRSGGGNAADGGRAAGVEELSVAKQGQWIAMPKTNNDWTVEWYDGTGVLMTVYQPINITYELVSGA